MPIDPNAIAQPESPEMVSGGSFIPQQPEQAQMPEMPAIADERALRGRASEVNDFNLTMRGIADGDPVGMETFDLGFFEDGTPAITINGANVPIRHEQWMTMLTQRNRTRAEVKARIEFEHDRLKARDSISRVIASAPSVPPQLGELLLAISDRDPTLALRETKQLLVSMSQDNGRTQISRLSTMIQDDAVGAELGRLLSEQEVEIGKNALTGEPMYGKTTAIRKRASELAPDKDVRKRKAAYAISNIESMFPPKGMKADPAINGGAVGVMDMVMREGADTGELSRFDMLRHLAAYSNLWPMSVDWEDTPQQPSGFVSGASPSSRGIDWAMAPEPWVRFRNYLMRLDEYGNKALKWDRSDPASIDMLVSQMMQTQAYRQQERQSAQQQGQQQTQQNSTDAFSIDLES